MVKLLNSRMPDGVAPIKAESLGWRNKGSQLRAGAAANAAASGQHVAKYSDCGKACVKGVAEFYAEDLAFFDYQWQKLAN